MPPIAFAAPPPGEAPDTELTRLRECRRLLQILYDRSRHNVTRADLGAILERTRPPGGN